MSQTHIQPTLQARLSTSDNALGAVRLTLAILVIFGHAFPLAGFPAFQWGVFVHDGLHGAAVDGFFVISGYLILASAIRTQTLGYFWRRFLRIYPGYVFAILMVAFVFAPLGGLIENGAKWDASSSVQYVFGALDLKPSQDGIRSTLLSVPWPETWNGSLWTLFYEALAYIGVAIICLFSVIRRNLRVLIPLLAIVSLSACGLLPSNYFSVLFPNAIGVLGDNGLRLWTHFLLGMCAYVIGHRIRFNRVSLIVALSIFLVFSHVHVFPEVATRLVTAGSLAVTVLAAGAALNTRIGSKNDLSYGIYIYAFPVQQILILLGVRELGWFLTAFTCLAVTMILAWFSWIWIERPALKLKHVVPAKKWSPAR